jgi:ketosteroid isomerase-like protein
MKQFIFILSMISILISCKNESPKDAALRTLREADRAWCQSASNLEGFMSFLDDDVVWYFCNYPQLKGKEALRSVFTKMYEDKSYSLTWTPEQIEVSASGDIGYTYGKYKYKMANFTEAQSEQIRNYATIWRKQKDNTWKVILEADF